MPPDVHYEMLKWLRDAESAYAERNRLVHSDHALSFDDNNELGLL